MDLKEAGKRIIFPILSMRGLQAHLIRKINDDSLTLVLNFHKVSPQKNSYWSPLPPDIFEELLIFLKNISMLPKFNLQVQL
jgi:hypothetical protein